MVTVGTAELKNNLSRYLKRVRKGESVVVTDRNEPIARLVPIAEVAPQTHEELLAQLAREGLITYDPNARPPGKHPKIKLKGGISGSELIIQMRRENRY